MTFFFDKMNNFIYHDVPKLVKHYLNYLNLSSKICESEFFQTHFWKRYSIHTGIDYIFLLTILLII